MLGLVYSEIANRTFAASTEPLLPAEPMPMTKVWYFKTSWYIQALGKFWALSLSLMAIGSSICFSGVSMALTPASFWEMLFVVPFTGLGAVTTVFGLGLGIGIVKQVEWQTAPWRDAFRYSLTGRKRLTLAPAEVQELARNLEDRGLFPKVEYLYEDPFLVVDIDGKRYYMAHWW